jgi:hypothetical protein
VTIFFRHSNQATILDITLETITGSSHLTFKTSRIGVQKIENRVPCKIMSCLILPRSPNMANYQNYKRCLGIAYNIELGEKGWRNSILKMVVIIVSPKFNFNQVEYFKTISFRKYKYNTILSLRNLILRILVFLLYLPKAKKTEPRLVFLHIHCMKGQ